MLKFITTHYLDNIEVSEEEWRKALNDDIEAESKSWGKFNLKSSIFSDLGNGRDIIINDHLYKRRTVTEYNAPRELLSDIVFDGNFDMLYEVLDSMPDEELFALLSKVKHVTAKDSKLYLSDKKDW